MTAEDELSPATVLRTRPPAAGGPEDELESALADRLSRRGDQPPARRTVVPHRLEIRASTA